jgi:hypothetical protein
MCQWKVRYCLRDRYYQVPVDKHEASYEALSYLRQKEEKYILISVHLRMI